MKASATKPRTRAMEFFGEACGTGKRAAPLPAGTPAKIAADIAERRERPSTEDRNRKHDRELIWNRRIERPTGPSLYEIFCKPRGMAAACANCTRQVELGGNCPGRPASPSASPRQALPVRLRRIGLPDCHSAHDADRAAVQAALDERDRKEEGLRS